MQTHTYPHTRHLSFSLTHTHPPTLYLSPSQECLQDMYRMKLEPTAAHYNLVIRTLKAEGYVEKMFKMVMAISHKEGAKINANTFELCIEVVY